MYRVSFATDGTGRWKIEPFDGGDKTLVDRVIFRCPCETISEESRGWIKIEHPYRIEDGAAIFEERVK